MTWQESSRVSRWGSHVGFHIRSVWWSLYAGQLAPMTSSGLDRIDHRILAVLQEDASRSAAQIAEAVGLSQSPCWRRIQRLHEEGYISKVVALLDRKKIGLRAQLFVQVKVISNDQAIVGNQLGGTFGADIFASVFTANGSYASAATFNDGFVAAVAELAPCRG